MKMTANFAHGASIVFVITMGKIMLKNFFVFRALIDGTVPNDRQCKMGRQSPPREVLPHQPADQWRGHHRDNAGQHHHRLDTTPSCGPSS